MRRNRPLRVALVCDWYLPRVGGIETHVSDLARQLASAGHAVDIVTTAAGRRTGSRVDVRGGAALRSPAGVRVVRLDVPLLPRVEIACGPGIRDAVGAALAAGGYDVVHCHTSVLSPLAFAAAYRAQALGLPCVVTHHSVLARSARVLSAVDRFVGWSRWPVLYSAVSPLVADEIRELAPALDVRVLPNAIRPQVWAVPPRSPSPADREPGVVHVASVMRLAHRKRPRALVGIAERVVAELPPGLRVRFRIAGDGPARSIVERQIRRAGLENVVELLGWRPRAALRALYAASDLFVLPSVLESFGIAALEARCAGLPVVAMRRAGVAGFVRHEREGLLAEDDADMAAQIVRLATDEQLRRAITRHNRSTIPAETWDAVLARHEALYAEAIAMRGLPIPQVRPAPRRARAAGRLG
ncbi:glycosyl transferase group 1 [Gemmatirosa kalamazoonensis]|uniref:Glycosyl transferase group 1 n=1 Tax=Gemmatirosa kalamazoonensis TaxID=861299 RepID=W0RCZ9_9BACT|nr:glycosyltransferase family 4 protein [Gemmatirosa kalamazoonensis]AHG88312.1 glycosyl transferase group 1 [Gemmatirosa kalamazoonensis]